MKLPSNIWDRLVQSSWESNDQRGRFSEATRCLADRYGSMCVLLFIQGEYDSPCTVAQVTQDWPTWRISADVYSIAAERRFEEHSRLPAVLPLTWPHSFSVVVLSANIFTAHMLADTLCYLKKSMLQNIWWPNEELTRQLENKTANGEHDEMPFSKFHFCFEVFIIFPDLHISPLMRLLQLKEILRKERFEK